MVNKYSSWPISVSLILLIFFYLKYVFHFHNSDINSADSWNDISIISLSKKKKPDKKCPLNYDLKAICFIRAKTTEIFVSVKKWKNKQTPNQLLTILSTFHSLAHSPVSYQLCSGLDQPLVHTKDKSQSLKNK